MTGEKRFAHKASFAIMKSCHLFENRFLGLKNYDIKNEKASLRSPDDTGQSF